MVMVVMEFEFVLICFCSFYIVSEFIYRSKYLVNFYII